jgi:hypothetical protein
VYVSNVHIVSGIVEYVLNILFHMIGLKIHFGKCEISQLLK